ncbi:MAG: AI-2E family transporter [Pirellulaceae bacterium]
MQTTHTDHVAPLDRGAFTHRTLVVIGLVSLVVVVASLIWAGADVLLLIFGGVLLGVFLRGLSDLLSRFTPLKGVWSLVVVLLILATLLGLGTWFLGAAIAGQLDQLGQSLAESQKLLQAQLAKYAWWRQILKEMPTLQVLGRGQSISRMTSIFSTTVGAVLGLVVILFTGLFLAFDPGLYRRGVLRLVSRGTRRRAGEILDALEKALRGWLVSQSFSMTVVGLATALGLWLLGIPLALALGFIAFLFTFVPYVGPIVATVPAVLVALTVGPTQALYVGLFYFGVQMIEGNLLTPLIQQQMVKLPPALTISAQMLMGVLLGTVGIVFATPLAACCLVLVQMLYVEDTLGDSLQKPLDES